MISILTYKLVNLVGYMAAFSWGAALARLTAAGMYLQVIYHSEVTVHREYFVVTAASLAVSGALFVAVAMTVDALRPQNIHLGLFVIALLVENPIADGIYIVRRSMSGLSVRPPTHVAHLISRHGQFLLLILGEAIIQLALAPKEVTIEDYVRGCLAFSIVYALGDCYYQQQIAINTFSFTLKTSLVGYIWEAMHTTLRYF